MKIKINKRNLPIVGGVCGDIIGSYYELSGNGTKNRSFPLFVNGSVFTDDTVCTLAVADAIQRCEDFVPVICKWCRNYPDAGYGNYFRAWFQSDDPQPYNSNRNGAAMYVSTARSFANSIDEDLRHILHRMGHQKKKSSKRWRDVSIMIWIESMTIFGLAISLTSPVKEAYQSRSYALLRVTASARD